jgi:diaminohydroxyphosphoribosylaminopyrimidine deaminase/5-amino-6-(5-phosphoribosylamino)uracil reductase
VSIDVAAAMAMALDEAREGQFRVEPNPTVGAVVLDASGEVVGRGAHLVYGAPHAEVAALTDAGPRARGGTVVVTLEPCAHTGKKTPPCVPALVAAGVARVVAGVTDPNPATSGRAAAALAAAGIAYECGVLEERCRAAIARYAAHLPATRPWVIAKWAASLDGRIADADWASRWISGPAARSWVFWTRAACDAVVVGSETVQRDDPTLLPGPEKWGGPLRVVLDSRLRTPPTARLVATARRTTTLVVTIEGADASRRRALEAAGAQVVEVAAGADGRVNVTEAFSELFRRGVRRALLEAGGTLQAACLRSGVVDHVAAFVAPVVIGGGGPTPFEGEGWPIGAAPRLEEVRVTPVAGDTLIEGYWPSKSIG